MIYTIGHGDREIEELFELLQRASVERLVDVRTAPGSRRHPQFGEDALGAALQEKRIAYEWKRELGGFRRPRPDSPNTALRSASFRGYADYMATPEFAGALAWLVDSAGAAATAIMCAESLWWRCHRRVVSDAIIARGKGVRHLMEGGRLDDHRLTPGARIVNGGLVYDAAPAQQELPARITP